MPNYCRFSLFSAPLMPRRWDFVYQNLNRTPASTWNRQWLSLVLAADWKFADRRDCLCCCGRRCTQDRGQHCHSIGKSKGNKTRQKRSCSSTEWKQTHRHKQRPSIRLGSRQKSAGNAGKTQAQWVLAMVTATDAERRNGEFCYQDCWFPDWLKSPTGISSHTMVLAIYSKSSVLFLVHCCMTSPLTCLNTCSVVGRWRWFIHCCCRKISARDGTSDNHRRWRSFVGPCCMCVVCCRVGS